MLSPSHPILFVNKHIDTEMLYCWLIVSKFCPNVTETDICPYLGMSLDIPVLYQLSLKVNPPAKASIDDSTTLKQVHDTLSHYIIMVMNFLLQQ